VFCNCKCANLLQIKFFIIYNFKTFRQTRWSVFLCVIEQNNLIQYCPTLSSGFDHYVSHHKSCPLQNSRPAGSVL